MAMPELVLPSIEVVSEKVHDDWVAQKLAAGVTSRPSQATGEEQIAPWDCLSDTVKELDRATVRVVYKAITESYGGRVRIEE